jgi:hypothetical protein
VHLDAGMSIEGIKEAKDRGRVDLLLGGSAPGQGSRHIPDPTGRTCTGASAPTGIKYR